MVISESQTVTMGQEERGEVNMGGVSRLDLSGPGSEGVSVRICVDRGVIVVYGSYTSPNPNLALNDFSAELRAQGDGEITPTSCLATYATLDDVQASSEDEEVCSVCRSTLQGRRKRQVEEEEREVVIYITIEGASDETSHFTVDSAIGGAFGKKILKQ